MEIILTSMNEWNRMKEYLFVEEALATERKCSCIYNSER